MTELIIGLLVILLLTINGLQNYAIKKQQSQIDFLRETLTEYMENMNRFVQAQNDANEAVINALAKDEELDAERYNVIMALARHVEYMDEELQECKKMIKFLGEQE